MRYSRWFYYILQAKTNQTEIISCARNCSTTIIFFVKSMFKFFICCFRMWWMLLSLLWWCGTSAVPAPGQEDWRCPEIQIQPVVECSCDMPHTLRCTGDKSALKFLGMYVIMNSIKCTTLKSTLFKLPCLFTLFLYCVFYIPSIFILFFWDRNRNNLRAEMSNYKN